MKIFLTLLTLLPSLLFAQGSYDDIVITPNTEGDSVVVQITTEGDLMISQIEYWQDDTIGYNDCHIYYQLLSNQSTFTTHSITLPVIDAWNCTMLFHRYIDNEPLTITTPNNASSLFVIDSWCYLGIRELPYSYRKRFYSLAGELLPYTSYLELPQGFYIEKHGLITRKIAR